MFLQPGYLEQVILYRTAKQQYILTVAGPVGNMVPADVYAAGGVF